MALALPVSMRKAIPFAALFLSTSLAFAQDPPSTPPPAEPAPTTPAGETPGQQPTGTMTPQPRRTGPDIDSEEHEVEAETHWGIGARSRFIFMPAGVIELFVEHATSMNSVSFGGEVIRRKGNFDIVFGIEYGNISPEDGLYQEPDEDPSMMGMYPDYVRFDNFALLSLDASFLWHVNLTDFMMFRYGAGIGIGVVLGGFTQTDTTCNNTTTIDDLDNPNACTLTGTPEDGDPPPVVPIVNLLLGLRFKIADQLGVNIEAGFRDVFFVGGGIGYFF
jgi:hypothetical protein